VAAEATVSTASDEEYAAAHHDGVAEALGNSLRRLIDAAVVTDADDDEMQSAVTAIDVIASLLEGADGERLQPGMPWPAPERMRRGDRPHNPVIGIANPLAPPMPIRVLPDKSVVSEITMRPVHEGPRGTVHGGWVASLLDQLLGTANIVAGVGAMTAELTIRYRKGTPLGVPLTLSARTDSIDGRKVFASGEIVADGVVTAEATGVFIQPSTHGTVNVQQLLDARSEA
jgi:acyl-coenzyme A thioesterase PaaI-like protein